MSRKYIFLLFYIVLFSVEAKAPLVVTLPTEEVVKPVLLFFYNRGDFFDVEYRKKIEEALRYDLQHSGEVYLQKEDNKEAQRIVEVELIDHEMTVKIYSKKPLVAKKIGPVKLKKDLKYDRNVVHRLADSIIKNLCEVEGIASTKILYTLRVANSQEKGGWSSEVWEAEWDGQNARQVTQNSSYAITPYYLPDRMGNRSDYFFYVSYKMGQSKIILSSLKDHKSYLFCDLSGNQLMPTISLHSDKMAFISDITGEVDLFIRHYHDQEKRWGKPKQVYSLKQKVMGSPTFSPDGKKIAFVSNENGVPQIFILDVLDESVSYRNAKKPLAITSISQESTAPSWSPNGERIAYCSSIKGVRQIFVYDVKKRTQCQLTEGKENKENPHWAPNSKHLIYNTSGKDGTEIFVTHADQKWTVQIPLCQGEKRFPKWSFREKVV